MDDHDGADAIERAWRDGLKPDPLLTVSEWADRYRVLSQRASSEPGRWRTERTQYLREIMDCLSPSSPMQRVALMKGAQIGGTECGNCWIGYVIHQAPGPMMAVSPTVELAKRNSKQRIDPLIEESEALRERVKERRSRDSGNTVLAKAATISDDLDPVVRDRVLASAAGGRVYNLSRFTFPRLIADPDGLVRNLNDLVNGYPQDLRDVFIEHFKLPEQVERLRSVDRLYQVVQRFGEIELHPDRVPNIAMGYIFKELIRRFSEARDENAGDHFTPREVIRLMVDLLFYEDHEVLTQRGIVRTVFDPACGTGGMLTVAEDYVRELNPQATLVPHGQDWNSESYAICKSDMLMSGQDPANIVKGDSFTQDGFAGRTFDYMLSNPPFGVDWKAIEKSIRDERERQGFAGRFGAGLPRVSDGSLLFVQHMISKMRRDAGVSRIAVVLNGSPLFTGGAGSGESEIRRWIIENDWLEAIVGLPTELFYNTGIATYVWIITNQKTAARRGKVQLIDATARWQRMRKSLGQKRKLIPDDARAEIVRAFGDLAESDTSKVFDNQDFGFRRIAVERPLRLNFRIDDERIARVRQQSAFESLAKSRKRGTAAEAEIEAGKRLQGQIVATLEGAHADDTWTSRKAPQDAIPDGRRGAAGTARQGGPDGPRRARRDRGRLH